MKLGKLRVRKHHLPHIGAGLFALVLILGAAGPFTVSGNAHAELLDLRSLKMSDTTPSATNVSYTFGFTNHTTGTVGSIRFAICSNYIYDPAFDSCTAPTGFDATSAVLSNQTGITDFTLSPASSGSELILTRPAGAINLTPMTFEFSGLTNPSNIGTFYARISTYASTDGTGPETDYGTTVGSVNQDINITTEVPPYLQFCTGLTIDGFNCGTATGNFINFGELSIFTTRAATSQMLAATNAPSGYSITLAGSTMTAGTNVIPAMTGGPSTVGTSQFGLNARQNPATSVGADPDGPGLVMPKAPYGTPDSFRFVSGDIITATNAPDDYRKFTVSYIVNRSKDQAAGRYVATISYICLGNF